MTAAQKGLYYFYRMTHKPPPVPTSSLTKMEAWYLDCLRRWVANKRRAPAIQELAAWCDKSRTATYHALVSCEHKGYTTRVGGEGDDRRSFIPVERVELRAKAVAK